MEPVAISQSCMKQAVEIHVSGAISRVFKGGWWCCYHANKNGEKGVGGIAIHQETENAKQGTVLPVKKNLIKAVGEILFGFQDRNEIYDYPCPYVCELHINNDGTCRYRTTGADVSPWEDIHHKRNNTVTAYLAYNAKGSIEWYQAQELLLHPIGVDFIVSVLKKSGATNIDTEYITKSPCGNAGINTEGTEDGINMFINISNLSISLDSSVKHITKTACMALSGTIENGLLLTNNETARIVIYKDRIDFGQCLNPELSGISGMIFPNFYKEYNNIVYRFGSNLKCSFFGSTIDYVGAFAPTTPDNPQLFNLIYPRFS